VSLEVQNVLRLTAFKMTMEPEGVLVIEGKNEQGKSSAVKSLEIVLAGMSETPPEPLHGDSKKGHIIATFDGLVVKKVFRAGKPPVLTVTKSNGARVKGPQTLLDTLLNRSCLRPTRLMEASEKEQVRILSEIMGFDSSEYDAEIERIFNLRRDANREAKRLAAVADATTFHEDAPDEEVSVSELMGELQKRKVHNDEMDKRSRDAQDKQEAVRLAQGRRGIAANKITDLENALEDARREMDERTTELKSAQLLSKAATALAHEDQPANEGEIADQIATADDINRKVRDNIEREKAVKEAKAAQTDADGYDKALDVARTTREAARLEARDRLPIPELDISEDCVLYKGKPFSQAGNSAQLRVSVAVAIGANKDNRIKLLLIDNAEKLDEDGVRTVMEMAQEAGYQVIMTRVISRAEDASEASVVIEDGAAKPVDNT
jgi:hypothetical protein